MNPITQFREIVAAAGKAFRPESGAPEIIPFGAALVELVRANPREREAFEREFMESTAVAPPELLEFCMHALRWESLRTVFRERQDAAIARNDWRSEPYYRHLLEAFDDEWEDATDFYAEYFRGRARERPGG